MCLHRVSLDTMYVHKQIQCVCTGYSLHTMCVHRVFDRYNCVYIRVFIMCTVLIR